MSERLSAVPAEVREESIDHQVEEDATPIDTLLPSPENFTPIDPFDIYLQEIGSIPLLTEEEEMIHARRLEEAKKVLNSPAAKDLEVEEIKRLETQKREAQTRLMEANSKLVVWVAKKFQGRGLDILDLTQAGNMGLMKAINKFKLSEGKRLTTFAVYYIRGAVQRAIAESSRNVRLPVHMHDRLIRVGKIEQQLRDEFGREATLEEIAERMDLSVAQVKKVLYLRKNNNTTSIHEKNRERENEEIGNLILDNDKGVDPEEQAITASLREHVQSFLSQLSDKERRVMELRYGIRDNIPRTLDEVGKEIGASKEWVRQIEKRVSQKFREELSHLKDFL